MIIFCFSKQRHSSEPLQDSCSIQNGRKVRDLQNDCSDNGKNFDSWVRQYTTSNDLYTTFTPCSGSILNEQRVKMVIKFCYCYNFCGTGQTRNGCEVEGLEGRLDLGANLFSSYRAMCVINLSINTNSRWSDALSVSLIYFITRNLNEKQNDSLAENEVNKEIQANPLQRKIESLSP